MKKADETQGKAQHTFAKGTHVRYRLPGFTTSELLADCGTEANAEMIAHRWNSHEQLVAALKRLKSCLFTEQPGEKMQAVEQADAALRAAGEEV